MPEIFRIAAAVFVVAACIKMSIPTKAELAATDFRNYREQGTNQSARASRAR
jgi:hypothetical protein